MASDLPPDTTVDPAALLAEYDAAIRRTRALSLRYGLGTGLFMGAALLLDNPWLALPVWGVLLAWLWIRYRNLVRRRDMAARHHESSAT